jgi:hypothetical protein
LDARWGVSSFIAVNDRAMSESIDVWFGSRPAAPGVRQPGGAAGYHPLDFAHQSSNRRAASKEAAQPVLALSDQQIGALLASGELTEVGDDGRDKQVL